MELTELDRRLAKAIWQNRVRPDNGLLLASGQFLPIRITSTLRYGIELELGKLQTTSVAFGIREWREGSPLDGLGDLAESGEPVFLPEKQAVVRYGEGSWGGDGFVALEDAISGNLIWLLCCDETNPIDAVRIAEASSIEAHTTSDLVWTIPIDAPLLLSVREANSP